MTGSEELTEEELVPLENKAYAYYDELIDHVLKTRAESGNTEDLTQEEYEKFQQMARVRLEYYKSQYLKERRAKESCLKHSQYILNIKPIEAPTNFTSRQYWDFIMPELTKLVDEDKPGEQFRLNEKTEFMLKMFCHYFAEDERFYWYCRQNFDGQPIIIDGRPDLNKGLGCFGNNGVGKSLFLKAFRNNPRFSYIYKKAKRFPEIYQKAGLVGLSEFFKHIPGNEAINFGQQNVGLAMDELNAEPLGYHYKSPCETAESVMYERWENLPGFCTHFSTNHTLTQLENRYGTRFHDRMMGKVNLILFPDMPSFRQ